MKNITKTLILLTLLISFQSQALLITAGFTGAWYNDTQPGQGFLIQILEGDEENTALVVWFTFDSEGNQMWLMGTAPVDGEQVSLDMSITTGGVLDASGFDNSGLETDAWGSLTLSFQNCNKGSVEFVANDPEIGTGTDVIKRLTKTVGSACSGGISDNDNPGDESDIQVDFVNTGEDDDASGRLKFEQNSQFNQLKIWYKDLPEGTYDLVVDGEVKASLEAAAHGSSHQFFSSPQHEDWILLDFEVLGKTVEISQDGVVYLTVDVPSDNASDEGDGTEG